MRNDVLMGMAIAWLAAASAGQIEAQTAAPAGWDASQQGETTVLTRAFGSDELTLHVSPWFSADGEQARDWIEARKSLPSGRNPVVDPDPKVVESKLPGSYYTLRDLRKRRGREQLSFLTVCTGADGKLRSIDVFGAKQTVADKTELEEHLRIALTYCTDSGSGTDIAQTARKATNQDSASSTAAAEAASGGPVLDGPIAEPTLPPGFKDLRGVIHWGIQPGGLFGQTDKTVALFDDGTYTDDIATVFGDSVAASKRDNPKEWGNWRISGDELQLKGASDDDFEESSGDWIAEPGIRDQQLNGCFGRIVSNDGLGVGTVMVGQASSWCFWPNGRFTHDSTTFGLATGGGLRGAVSSSPPGVRGRYRIDGYAMRLIYDDGSDVQVGFAFLDDDREHIAINGRRFLGGED